MYTIKAISCADKVKGQGVGSCYLEQVDLIKKGLSGKFDVLDAGALSRTRAADINHYHSIEPANYIGNLVKSQKTSSVCYVHFLPETVADSVRMPSVIRKLFDRYVVSFYKSMDYLVTVNPAFVSKLIDLGIDRSRVAYIPNTVSSGGFRPLSEERVRKARRDFGLPPDKFVALGVGQLQKRKGVDDFIEVAKRLPDILFVWAGGFSFGRLSSGYDRLRELVANPPSNVRFLGIVGRDKMNEVYNAADALFLPSYSELFPMAILEAMGCGKPLALRNLDEYKPIIDGCYIGCDSLEDFKRAIRRLNDDGAYYKEWSARSTECGKRYDGSRILEMWDRFYSMVVDNCKERGSRPRASGSRGSRAAVFERAAGSGRASSGVV